jgi:TolA-binding protein
MWVAFIVSALVLTAFSACGTVPPSEHLPQVSDSRSSSVEPMVAQSAVLHSLQRQVRERDRRIAELTFQLEALKTIDREAEARRQQGRFPGTRDR